MDDFIARYGTRGASLIIRKLLQHTCRCQPNLEQEALIMAELLEKGLESHTSKYNTAIGL